MVTRRECSRSGGRRRQQGDADDDQDDADDLDPRQALAEQDERRDRGDRRELAPRTAVMAMLSREPQAESIEPRTSPVPAMTTSGSAARVTVSRRCER